MPSTGYKARLEELGVKLIHGELGIFVGAARNETTHRSPSLQKELFTNNLDANANSN